MSKPWHNNREKPAFEDHRIPDERSRLEIAREKNRLETGNRFVSKIASLVSNLVEKKLAPWLKKHSWVTRYEITTVVCSI